MRRAHKVFLVQYYYKKHLIRKIILAVAYRYKLIQFHGIKFVAAIRLSRARVTTVLSFRRRINVLINEILLYIKEI